MFFFFFFFNRKMFNNHKHIRYIFNILNRNVMQTSTDILWLNISHHKMNFWNNFLKVLRMKWPPPPTPMLWSSLCYVWLKYVQPWRERKKNRERKRDEVDRVRRGENTVTVGEQGENVSSNTSCHLILLKGQRLEIKTKFEINEAHSGGDIRFWSNKLLVSTLQPAVPVCQLIHPTLLLQILMHFLTDTVAI